MEITFLNVRIVVDADSPEAAYRVLDDEVFQHPAIKEWTSDVFTQGQEEAVRDTAELFDG